jgi:hypothetical protein
LYRIGEAWLLTGIVRNRKGSLQGTVVGIEGIEGAAASVQLVAPEVLHPTVRMPAEIPSAAPAAAIGEKLTTGPGAVLVNACTDMVTVFETAPPMEIVTGTAFPVATVAGTCTFTWYTPTNPGARPENCTRAETPPMFTRGVVVV